jgi:hypothetical protein
VVDEGFADGALLLTDEFLGFKTFEEDHDGPVGHGPVAVQGLAQLAGGGFLVVMQAGQDIAFRGRDRG